MSQPSKHTCDLVDARDEARCVRCGKSLYNALTFSRHHRRMRSHPFPGLHEASNVIDVCGSGSTFCHGWIHEHPREAMANGWLVSGFEDHPETVPVLTAQHGWALLGNDGNWTPTTQPKETA
jgi:hypothetical protein